MKAKFIHKKDTTIYMFETDDAKLQKMYESNMNQLEQQRKNRINECAGELHYYKDGLRSVIRQREMLDEKYQSYTLIGRLIHYHSYRNQISDYDREIQYNQTKVNDWREELWEQIHKPEDMNNIKHIIHKLLDNNHYRKLTEKTKSNGIITEYWVKTKTRRL